MQLAHDVGRRAIVQIDQTLRRLSPQPHGIPSDAEGMARKFIFGTGTLGDLLPLLAMAREMQARGHACHVLGNASAPVVSLAEQLGVPFTPIAPAQTNNMTSVEESFGNIVFASYQPTFDFIERELRRGA